ncbi:MAG: hypothetical protein ACI9W2_004511, partial [Gammaproteobacteria bacterium]
SYVAPSRESARARIIANCDRTDTLYVSHYWSLAKIAVVPSYPGTSDIELCVGSRYL